MILIIDNYDSFTQNLGQYVGQLGFKPFIVRNDEISINNIQSFNPTHVFLSPGPGKPENSGICLDIINNYANKLPILGICLGHQVIGYIYGGEVKQLKKPMHGKISLISHNQKDIFNKVSNPFYANRYHSLVINTNNFPHNLEITAWTREGIIMGCKHKTYSKLRGVQFHPESLWTKEGQKIIKNFLLL
uniref:Anthranilate synthase component 2 n=1 Tax=Bostrychia simpliciuscula TaxID=324754 RepID=A0A1Z1M7Z0_9FLOR|nr:Anthranilate synthase component II [Bostrychia simpliciuscula]ARW62012.1 Anthranilate synthase component II [Bostrychia simpliciuscula]